MEFCIRKKQVRDKVCPNLLKTPFVCNSCIKRNLSNYIYPCRCDSARQAQKEYEEVLSALREGIPLTKEEFLLDNKTAAKAVIKIQQLQDKLGSHAFPSMRFF